MRFVIPIGIAVAALSLSASAQDTKVKSETEIKADDANIVMLTGCLRQEAVTGRYFVQGTVAAAGDRVKSRTTVETDVDRSGTTVKSETKTDADDAVATSGVMSTFFVVPGNKVSLASHVGHQVQMSAVMLKPGHDDADVQVKDRTTVDPEHGRDTTARSKTKVEIEGAVPGQYTIVSVKPLPGACPVL